MQDTTFFIRPGQTEDLPAVQELCKDVWGGNDYVPSLWNKWLADPANFIFVLEIEEKIAGFYSLYLHHNKTTKMGWWQGVRVATAFKRQGLAARLLEHAIAESRKRGLHRLRYITSHINTPMHKLGDRYGFQYVAPYSFLNAPRLDTLHSEDMLAQVRSLQPDEIENAWKFIEVAPTWKAGKGIHCDDWKWKDLEPETVLEWLELGQVYGCFEKNDLIALALVRHQKEPDNIWSFVGWLDGYPTGIGLLARYLQIWATRQTTPKQETVLDLMLVRDEVRDQLLQEIGFRLDSEWFRLYELSLSDLSLGLIN
jgi:GNAT superfamily N-acetyltransferase